MKLTYEPRYNVAYLRLHEKTAEVETIRVSDELNVDVAPDGTVYGIELLNANEQLRAGDEGALDVIREGLGLINAREALRQAIAAGAAQLDRGEGIPGEQVFEELRTRSHELRSRAK